MLKCSIWAPSALVLAVTCVYAQGAGQIVGNVRDASSAVIPTVKVTAKETGRGYHLGWIAHYSVGTEVGVLAGLRNRDPRGAVVLQNKTRRN
jgi:hypothetical protein